MSKTYTTVQGDMWDSIAYKVYGKEHSMDALLKANEAYKDVAVFPQGIKITCPDVNAGTSDVLPPWRR